MNLFAHLHLRFAAFKLIVVACIVFLKQNGEMKALMVVIVVVQHTNVYTGLTLANISHAR